MKYKNSLHTFLLIASRLTCQASGRHSDDPEVSEVSCLHLQWSSSPRAARPTVSHPRRPSKLYLLLNGGQHVLFYRSSKLNLRTKWICMTEYGWAHSAARLMCSVANCGVAQTGHPPYPLDLISAHVCFLWNKTRHRKISGCRQHPGESNRRNKCSSFGCTGWPICNF